MLTDEEEDESDGPGGDPPSAAGTQKHWDTIKPSVRLSFWRYNLIYITSKQTLKISNQSPSNILCTWTTKHPVKNCTSWRLHVLYLKSGFSFLHLWNTFVNKTSLVKLLIYFVTVMRVHLKLFLYLSHLMCTCDVKCATLHFTKESSEQRRVTVTAACTFSPKPAGAPRDHQRRIRPHFPQCTSPQPTQCSPVAGDAWEHAEVIRVSRHLHCRPLSQHHYCERVCVCVSNNIQVI